MKKILTVILAVVYILTLTSCKYTQEDTENKINVVCTVFPQYDFVRQIAKDKVNLTMLLPPGSEAHTYEPSPRDIISLKEADLFVAIGGESEHWAKRLLEGKELKDTPALFLMDCVNVFAEEHKDGMEHLKHEDESHNEEYDEHIWTSPQNAVLMCKSITDALIKADGKNASFYENNAREYIGNLQELANEFDVVCKSSKRHTLIFADRFPMRYLTESLSLDYYAAFPGCSSKTEPSVSTVFYLTQKVKKENIPVVLYMDYSDGRIAKTIAKECGVKTGRLYSCHSLCKSDFANGETYVSLMKKNLSLIKEALN